MSKTLLKRSDVDPIASFLSIYDLRSMQRTDRTKEVVHRFSAIHLPSAGTMLEGFIRAPKQPDIRYEVDLTGPLPQVTILKGSGNFLADIANVKEELVLLCGTAGLRRAALDKTGDSYGCRGKKGFYLEVGVAKAQALQRFREAETAGIVSRDFTEFCVIRNFKMKFHK